MQQEKVKNVQKKMDNNEKKMKSEQLENMEKELNNLDKRLANVARQLELMREQLELMGKQLELMAKQLELMAKLLHGKSKTFLTVFGFQFIPIAGLLAIVLYIGILITLTIIRFGLHGISARNISEMMRSRTARTVFVIIFIMMLLNLVVQWNLQQELKELR
ncbi:MAG: hypothetical protein ACRDFB_02615 [Rhabdochlamydiaceae bacterium]